MQQKDCVCNSVLPSYYILVSKIITVFLICVMIVLPEI